MTAEFTKNEIKRMVLELLRQESLSELSVREITEACGVNRNTFYYHFRDIPAVVEEIVMDQTNELLLKHPTLNSMEECMYAILDLVRDNRAVIMHVYNSLSRVVFEKYLFEVCYVLAENYWNNAVLAERARTGLSDQAGADTDGDGLADSRLPDRRVVVDCYASVLFGLAMKWLSSGMDDRQARKDVPEVCRILRPGELR